MSGADGRFAAAQPGNAQKAQAMSCLLDADVLSQPAKRHGNAKVIAWLERDLMVVSHGLVKEREVPPNEIDRAVRRNSTLIRTTKHHE